MRLRFRFSRIKGAGYILWHGKHMIIHVLLGCIWGLFLKERWNEFTVAWMMTAVVGSLLPDLDHLLYFFTYGKTDAYTQAIMTFVKNHQWRALTTFISTGHKHNTSLTFHNYYATGFCVVIAALASRWDWEAGVVLFGAMASHFLFDIAEDLFLLGRVNPNWKRWGRGIRSTS